MKRSLEIDYFQECETAIVDRNANELEQNLRNLRGTALDTLPTNASKDTLLHFCVSVGRTSMAKVILRPFNTRVRYLKAENNRGNTALDQAVQENKLNFIILLADYYVANNLKYKLEEWYSEKQKCWLEETFGAHKLVKAVQSGKISLIRDPYYSKFVNYYDAKAKTALHYAVENSYLDIVKLLLELGANPNIRAISRNDGPTSLDYNCFALNKARFDNRMLMRYDISSSDAVKITKLLFEYGADCRICADFNKLSEDIKRYSPEKAKVFDQPYDLSLCTTLLGVEDYCNIPKYLDVFFSKTLTVSQAKLQIKSILKNNCLSLLVCKDGFFPSIVVKGAVLSSICNVSLEAVSEVLSIGDTIEKPLRPALTDIADKIYRKISETSRQSNQMDIATLGV